MGYSLLINRVYWGEITYLLTIDPKFLGHLIQVTINYAEMTIQVSGHTLPETNVAKPSKQAEYLKEGNFIFQPVLVGG